MGKMAITRRHDGYGRSLVEFQSVVLASLVVVATALWLGRPSAFDPVFCLAGAALIAVATAATVLWRQNASFQKFSLLLPLVDILGIRLVTLADQSLLAGGAPLLMVPMIWIAYSFGPWAFAVCVALVALTNSPGFIADYAEWDPANFTRLVAFPLTLAIMASAAGIWGTRMRRKRAELAEQTALTEKAVRARDDLIEAVTHELRTPLTSILGNAELMQSSGGDAQQVQRRAGVIVRNVEQMESILADLLLARSTDTSQFALQSERSDMAALLATSVATCQAAADSRQIAFVMAVERQLWVQADPQRIRQVLENLLTNAIKYNAIGGSVSVSETRTPQTITLAVTDNGNGIAAADRDRVFEPYYRTEAARRSSQMGTGLGLGISRDIARLHGGDLRLAHSSSAGSRFELTLPLAPALPSGLSRKSTVEATTGDAAATA
jgi:signal transduction histidine kinase